MEAALVAIAVGLAGTFVAFLSRQLLLPPLRRLGAWFQRPRHCRRPLDAARSELETNIERLASASLASREVEDDGSERVFYQFGSAYSGLRVPELPTLRRAAMDDLNVVGRRCLGDAAGLLEDAIAGIARYEAVDRDRFRDAWHGAMNPAIERTVMGDPGHQVNRANAKFVMDADRVMTVTREALVTLRGAIARRAGLRRTN